MKTTNRTDVVNMRLALSLARRGVGVTHPNPAVGCVLTRPDRGGRIVGRGWTQPGGRPHAETEALARAGDTARGATAYVTLEPCSHTGRTPPCADALIGAGVSRVVIAVRDPDARVAGSGVERLQSAGIDVDTGLLENEARVVNRGFFSRQLRKRPYVTLKLAMTVDGKIATRAGDSQWITSAGARAMGHALRARCDAVLTGAGTVRADDPALTCRLPGLGNRSPIRVVMCREGALPPASQLSAAAEPPTWLICVTPGNAGCEQIVVSADEHGRPTPDAALRALGERGINNLLIEAGAGIATSFVGLGLVDEIVCFRSGLVVGGDGLSGLAELGVDRLRDAPHFRLAEYRSVDGNLVERYERSG